LKLFTSKITILSKIIGSFDGMSNSGNPVQILYFKFIMLSAIH